MWESKFERPREAVVPLVLIPNRHLIKRRNIWTMISG
jgi:hypothetical protein